MKAKETEEQAEEQRSKFEVLRDAVRNLYYSAVWHADRPVDEAEKWTAVRDACGFPKGNSPKELPYDGVRLDYPTARLRLLGRLVTKAKGGDFGTDQTAAFLLLHSTELRDRVDQTVREFMKEKL